MNELGELFYQGRIINLSDTDIQELQNILKNIRNEKNNKKDQIDIVLEKMEF